MKTGGLRPVTAVLLVAGVAVIVVAGALIARTISTADERESGARAEATRAAPESSAAVPSVDDSDQESAGDEDQATDSKTSVWCGGSSVGLSAGPPDSPESLAWISQEVVKGTVLEELGPRWGPPSMTGPGVDEQFDGIPIRSISTEYLVSVEDRIRGNPDAEIRVGIEGGTIDDCTIEFHGPGLTPGEEVVLFLSERNAPDEFAVQDSDDRPVYRLVHVMMGIWEYSEQGTVTPRLLLEEADPSRENDAAALEHFTHDWSELRERLIVSLASGAPPEGEFRPLEIVPLEDAPLQAEES